MLTKRKMNDMNKEALHKYGKENGIELHPSAGRNDMIETIYRDQYPEASHEGIMQIARMIKFQGDLGKGVGGAYDFLRMVYPDQSDEDAKRMARIVDRTKYDA